MMVIIMEISKYEAMKLIDAEIENYRGCAIEAAKYQLYGMIDGMFKIGLISAAQVLRYTNKIKKIKPWEGS
jgi:hypothetical protein